MTYNVTFYGTSTEGKRQRVARGSVEAADPMGAMKSAHDLLGKAEADARGRVNEIRVEQATSGGFRWTKSKSKTTARK